MDLIFKVTTSDPQRPLSRLLQLPLGLDVWEVKSDHLVVRAGEPQAERLRQMGYEVEQLQETQRLLSTFATAEAIAAYHSFASVEAELQELAELEPDVVELQEIGRSIENRPIRVLRIGERSGNTRKVLLMGCHHAREWISVEVPLLLARHLVEHVHQSPVQEWLSQGEIWVAPMVNPDGHEHCRTENRLWRKNRRHNPDGSIGVDPNRNYGYLWGTLDIPTSSHVPSDDTYVGPRAFSEPETRAVRDLIGRELFSGVITYHSYSQLILYPWGYTEDPIPNRADRDRMVNLAAQMQELMRGVHDVVYTPQQSSALYPTAGDTTDWTYGIYGIPSFTVELRPQNFAQGGFLLPPEQIQPTWEENRPAAFEFIQTVLAA
jgi:carboxypeptidase T